MNAAPESCTRKYVSKRNLKVCANEVSKVWAEGGEGNKGKLGSNTDISYQYHTIIVYSVTFLAKYNKYHAARKDTNYFNIC